MVMVAPFFDSQCTCRTSPIQTTSRRRHVACI